jgi:rare lipoprotein A
MIKKSLLIAAFLLLSFSAFSINRTFYGKSSWYGGKFHGRTTASGEIYDMNKLTAAHRKLPFGTILKVINMDNGKSIQVKVNDRGPFVKGRVLDVSKKSAEELDFIKQGVANIKAEILFLPGKDQRDFDFQDEVINPEIQEKKDKTATTGDKDLPSDNGESIDQIIKSLKSELGADDDGEIDEKEEPKEGASTKKSPETENEEKTAVIQKDAREGKKPALLKKEVENQGKDDKFEQKSFQIFVIQLGAFTSKERAETFVKKVKEKGVDAYITQIERNNLVLFKVRENKIYKDIDTITERIQEFKKMGIECFAVGKFFVGS